MTDLTRITDALVALAKTIPDFDAIEITASSDGFPPWIRLSFKSDAGAIAAAKSLGVELEDTRIKTAHWITGDSDNEQRRLTVSGPHHQIREVPEIDSNAVTAALAQANAAVKEDA